LNLLILEKMMALITCSKCKKIIPASAASCPYCGEPYPGGARIFFGSKQDNIRGWIIIILLALLIVLFGQWLSGKIKYGESAPPPISSIQSSCLTTECPVGTEAVTVSIQQQAFYTCKSNELSEYANYVLQQMVSLSQQTGVAAEISSKTGEPVMQGKDKAILDQYRQRAHVSSFEEAISECYRGRSGQKVVVLSNPDDSKSIYVAAAADRKNAFWLPKSRLVRLMQ
jgi:hypothetical protein